jgi:DNA-binding NtrC family response regulator
MRKVWILDNDDASAEELRVALSTHAYRVAVWTDPVALLAELEAAAEDGGPDLVVIEHGLSRGDAIEVLRSIRSARRAPVVVVARRTSSKGAIDSMREGAFDYLPRETLPAGLEDAVRRALSADGGMIRTVGSPGPGDVADLGAIIGRTPEMVEIHKLIGQVATTDAPVLIHGESGTGKELIARAIHYNSDRRGSPFVAVNCAALPGDLLEKELFGWETASGKEAPGRFELARGGTVFLDEISETSPTAQGRLLTLMEEGYYERLGARARTRVDVRILAATGESLVNRMKEDRFRVDLFYRLKVVTVYIPPLRERRSDIPMLAEHFLERTKAKMRKNIEGITPAAMEILQNHRWPGNVRELEQVIQHAVALCRTDVLTPEDLDVPTEDADEAAHYAPESVRDLARSVRASFERLAAVGASDISDAIVSEVESVLTRAALESVGGNQVKAARLLGISRNTLRKRLAGGGS